MPSPEPTLGSCAPGLTPFDDTKTGQLAGQTGQCMSIQPDPLEQEPTDNDPGIVIHLPSLQSTQGFIYALITTQLDKSGMQLEDIESLQDPGPVSSIKDPSPLLRSLRHFINNSGSSWDH